MNTVVSSKTRRLAAKVTISIGVLVALACVITMFTAVVRTLDNARADPAPGPAVAKIVPSKGIPPDPPVPAETPIDTLLGGNFISATETPTDHNVVEPTFSNTPSCTDTWVRGQFDLPTHTYRYTLTLGNTPACGQVTWNFSNLTEGKNCAFSISSPEQQAFSLNFIDSNGNQKDHITVNGFMSTRENDIKQVQLDLSDQSNKTLTLEGMVYSDCYGIK